MKKLSQNITYWLGVVAIGLVVGLSLQFVRAWTEPAVAPPGGNIGAPVNTGGIAQTKSGNLVINALGISGAGNALLVPNGNVGIGTTGPANKLHLNGGYSTTFLQITSDAIGSLSTDGAIIGFEASDANLKINNRENGHMIFYTNNAERMRIDPGGNVGIGTTAPGSKLQVNGKIQAIGGDICTDQGGGKCLSAAGGGNEYHMISRSYVCMSDNNSSNNCTFNVLPDLTSGETYKDGSSVLQSHLSQVYAVVSGATSIGGGGCITFSLNTAGTLNISVSQGGGLVTVSAVADKTGPLKFTTPLTGKACWPWDNVMASPR